MIDSPLDETDASLAGAIEALLFVSDEPVSLAVLSSMIGVDAKRTRSALEELESRLLREGSGIRLREVAGGWRLYTHPRYHDLLERYVLSWDTRRLSQAAIETLAVIAYAQPVTRAAIASIRGVNSDSSVHSLVEKGLVKEAGRDDSSPGQPVLYATTKAFLEKFGLASAADLPAIEGFAPDERTRALIKERLGVVSPQDDAATFGEDDEAGFASDFSEGYGNRTCEGGAVHGR